MRRGRDCHLHGQVFLPPGSTQTSFTATSCRTIVHQREERRNSRDQLRHAGLRPACSSGPSLCDSPASLSDVFSQLGCMTSRRRSKDILPSSPCLRCRRLDSTIRAVLLSWVLSSHLGFTSAGVAPLSPRFRKLLDETVKTFAVCPSCLQLLDCDDNVACCSFH